MPAPADTVEIGAITRAHGLRGELRVRLHNPASNAFDRADVVVIGDATFDVASYRQVPGAVLLLVAGVADRDAAERLKGRTVSIARASLDIGDDDVLLADLVGLRAVLADGSDWGEVVRIEPGPQDRLVVRCADGERQLPIVDELVGAADLDAGTVLVHPPDGLP